MPIIVTYVVLPIVILLVGFGGGWAVHGWKTDAKITKMEERVRIADAENKQCEIDVKSARAGVKQITDALATKERDAQAAMTLAQVSAKKHSDLAAEIRNGPNRAGESRCDAIIREQKEYVQNRNS